MSFAACTAPSMRPPRSASSSSFTKTPRVPISPNGFVRSRSPAVVIGTRAISIPGARSRSAACSACVSASLLPRGPTRSSIVAEPEKLAQRVRVDGAVGPRGSLLHLHGRPMEQLVDDARCHSLYGASLRLRQSVEPRAHPRARRHDVPRRLPGTEPLCLAEHDLLGAARLAAATGETLGNDALEVVDVVEVAPVELVDRGI